MSDPDQILSVAQTRAAEDELIQSGRDISSLMDAAGRGAAEWVWRLAGRQRVTVLCGAGKNGGDGYILAQALLDKGGDVAMVAAGDPTDEASAAARRAFAGDVIGTDAERRGAVFVDCLFGSGLNRPLSHDHAALLNRLASGHGHRVAVDLPSGVEADSGSMLADRLPNYDLTLALGAWKFAHVLMPARSQMGSLHLVDIGLRAQMRAARFLNRPILAPPSADSHKYRRGLVAVVGGAMPGAASLAAEAALRAGAGYVRLSASQPARASHAIVQARDADFGKAKAILVGPGLGRDEAAWQSLGTALTSGVPTVVDADGLFLLAKYGLDRAPAPAIITPHEGEFAHLFADLQGTKVDRAKAAAARSGSVVVYKGADTVIAAPDGQVSVSGGSSSWLSTAGTGDVLAGLCASRLAVLGDPFVAACEAVWLHAAAAYLAGPAFAADDLVVHIPQAIAECL